MLSGVFLLASEVKIVQAVPLQYSDFQKTYNDTLNSENWNDLLGYSSSTGLVYNGASPLGNFVNTWLPTTMRGPLGINVAPSLTQLTIQASSTNNVLDLLNSSGTNILTVLNNGRVGIGTTAPNDFFNIGVSNSNGSLGTGHNSSATYVPGDDYALANVSYVQGVADAINIEAASSSLWNGVKNGNIWNGTSGAGNVGIGITNPAVPLNTYAAPTTGFVEQIRVGGTGNYPSLTMGTYGSYGGYMATYGNDMHLFAGNWRTVGTAATENHTMNFYTSKSGSTDWSTPKMVLNYNGNLGIGTTAPAGKLDVDTGINAAKIQIKTPSSGTPDISLNFYRYSGISGTYFPWRIVNGQGNIDDISFQTNTLNNVAVGSEVYDRTVLSLKHSGYVGIGTTAPNTTLEVSKAGPAYISITNTTNGGRHTLGYDASNNFVFHNAGGASRYLFNDYQDNSLLTILSGSSWGASNGFVGIGTTNPTTKLEVGGANYFKTYGTTVSSLGASGNVVVMADNNGSLFSTSTTSFISNNSLDLWKGTKNGTIWNGDAGVGNVGIGTTNPTNILTVQQAASAGGETVAALKWRSVNYDLGYLGADPATYNSGALYINKDGAANTRISGNGYSYFMGGNIGIGTTNPGYKFTIYDSNAVGGDRLLVSSAADNNTEYTGIRIQNSGIDNAAIRSFLHAGNPNSRLGFFVGDNTGNALSEKLSIVSDGDIGIGTTNPSDILHILKSGVANDYITTSIAEGVNLRISNPGNNWDGVAGLIFENSGGAVGTGYAKIGATIKDISDSDLFFQISNNGVIGEGMRITSTGYVGIGTTDPTTKLEVGGVNYIKSYAATVSSLGASGNVVVMADNNGSLFSTSTTSFISNNSLDLWKGTKNGTIWNGDAGAGNVGIGTTNPLYTLEVNGAINILGANPLRIGGAWVASYDGSNQITLGSNVVNTIKFDTSAAADVYINQGNVGIGTTNVTQKLTIMPPTGGGGISIRRVADNFDALLIRTNATDDTEVSTTNKSLNFLTRWDGSANQTTLFLNNLGNVGIGNTNPLYKLDIKDATSPSINLSYTGVTGDSLITKASDRSLKIYANTSGADYVADTIFYRHGSAGGEVMRIASTGNVGIGLTNPATKLDLSGGANYLKT
ncbi:MAG: hypothetical protein WC249_04465, partial [Patescibacteria group bacterium]